LQDPICADDAAQLRSALGIRMSEDLFVSTLEKVTTSSLELAELINVAVHLAGGGQMALAQQLYRVWINFNPNHPQLFVAYFNCAVLTSQAGDLPAAQQELSAAITNNPDFVPAYINLGGVLDRGGDKVRALEQWQAVLARLSTVSPSAVGYKLACLKQMGRMFGELQDLERAESALGECLSLNPHQRDVLEQFAALRLGQCKWPVSAPLDGLDRKAIIAGMHPLSMAAYTDDPMLQLGLAAQYVEQALDEQPGGVNDRRDAPIELSSRRMRIGYVSSDLRDHAVGYLMAELFELHDRSQVEVFAYYCGIPTADALNARTRAAVEHWRDIREMNDEQAAEAIARDGIDILVDVNGHTRDARTALFARRPAPIQVNWLGYPGTMGSPYHHYIIGDDWITPPGAELYFSEKVVRLPCYQPNDRHRKVSPDRPTRAQAGLPDEAFVFCCFNGAQKINPFTFARWMKILKRVPGSVLWLLDAGGTTSQRLSVVAEQHGVEPGRLVFAPKQLNPQHLARYPLADLFLDTAPYGAHTTASDALWTGVPVLTFSGRSFASRVCGSLVRSAGLPELVCLTADAYVARAIELASDRKQLSALRARLEAGRDSCDLFNMDLLTAKLEALYRAMCDDYRKGVLPQPDLTNLRSYLAIGADLDHEGEDMMVSPAYEAMYRTKLGARHLMRPMPADGRLWNQADIAAPEAREERAPVAAAARRRAAR
jgi:predicted O-linked N-acetylglucosamine transferase (SPINDLY family)